MKWEYSRLETVRDRLDKHGKNDVWADKILHLFDLFLLHKLKE